MNSVAEFFMRISNKCHTFFKSQIQNNPIDRNAYYCQPNLGSNFPMFCIVVTSTQGSNDLRELTQSLSKISDQQFCECTIVSISDVIAQTLEHGNQAFTS